MKQSGDFNLPSDSLLSAGSERNAQRLQRLTKTVKWTRILGVLGILPFIVFALLLSVIDDQNPLRSTAVDLLKTYSSVILSFIGGIRLGRVLTQSSRETGHLDLFWSIAPPTLGWLSLLLSTPYVFAVQTLAFAAFGAWDAFAGHGKLLPEWFVKLRIMLTFAVCAVLLTAFFTTS